MGSERFRNIPELSTEQVQQRAKAFMGEFEHAFAEAEDFPKDKQGNPLKSAELKRGDTEWIIDRSPQRLIVIARDTEQDEYMRSKLQSSQVDTLRSWNNTGSIETNTEKALSRTQTLLEQFRQT